MGIFTINVLTSYDDTPLFYYDNGVIINVDKCGGNDILEGPIGFNNGTNTCFAKDYIGTQTCTLTILSYSDVTTNESTNTIIQERQSVLLDLNDNPITYPYNINITTSTSNNVGVKSTLTGKAPACPINLDDSVTRTKTITYNITDNNGVTGRQATLTLGYKYN